ncbi:hypothetical protein Q19_22 [Pectobacterium phage Q19]|uniref:Uncharacterized protein n=1 Tax=Pectobacterium phage Q19 TaxID=2500576 RepID=A0A679A2W3_9CAUD|nr:hypothetical protein Q19_22 [Pectobacterium phage Q19]
MFKLINVLGKFVVKMYFREAKRLGANSKANSELADQLYKDACAAYSRSTNQVNQSAAVAAKAQALTKFFN